MDFAVHGWYVPTYSFSDRPSGSSEGGGPQGVDQTVLSFNPRYSDHGRRYRHLRVNPSTYLVQN